MKLVKLTGLAMAMALIVAPAMAATIDHEDPGGAFRTNRGPNNAPVGRLTVSSAQTG